MLKQEIEKRVRQLWRERRPKQPTGEDMFAFFCELQNESPELTTFPNSGDPWQTMHCWLLDEEKEI
jgi:hypothetical protein